jgi:hypothetical protein
MPTLGTRTVADCQALASQLHPQILGLRTAFGKLRPAWQRHDVFGAERYAKDLDALCTRWGAAIRDAQRVYIHPSRGAGLTFAPRQYERMIRAVRHDRTQQKPQPADLVALGRRLHTASRKLQSSFGYDILHPFDSALTASGVVKSMNDCANLIGQYGSGMNALPGMWSAARAAWQTSMGVSGAALSDRIYNGPLSQFLTDWSGALLGVALKLGDPSACKLSPVDFAQLILSDRGNESNPAQDEYDALMKAMLEGSAVRNLLLSQGQSTMGVDIPTSGDDMPPAGSATNTDLANAASFGLLNRFKAWAGAVKSLKDCQDIIANYGTWIPILGDRYKAVQPKWQAVDGSASATFSNGGESQAFSVAYARLVADWAVAMATVGPELKASGPSSTTPAASEYDTLLAASTQFTNLSAQLDAAAEKAGIAVSTLPSYSPTVQPTQDSSSAFLQQTSAAEAAAKKAVLGAWTAVKKEANDEVDRTTKPITDLTPWIKGGVVVAGIGVIAYAMSQANTLIKTGL